MSDRTAADILFEKILESGDVTREFQQAGLDDAVYDQLKRAAIVYACKARLMRKIQQADAVFQLTASRIVTILDSLLLENLSELVTCYVMFPPCANQENCGIRVCLLIEFGQMQ